MEALCYLEEHRGSSLRIKPHSFLLYLFIYLLLPVLLPVVTLLDLWPLASGKLLFMSTILTLLCSAALPYKGCEGGGLQSSEQKGEW